MRKWLLAVSRLFGSLARRARPEAQRPIEAAGCGDEALTAPPPSQPAAVPVATSTIPAGFDAAGLLRAAKANFIELQTANDAGQRAHIVALNANLLEVATEKGQHSASVRFSGMMRETPGTEPVGFEEVWNLVKPVDGSSGWLLAGIQQMH